MKICFERTMMIKTLKKKVIKIPKKKNSIDCFLFLFFFVLLSKIRQIGFGLIFIKNKFLKKMK